ncbi:MAG TPA: hypothetical protein VLX44_03570 [Xanthobacteraceae bacterium]|nr:hypothetical protein [Xanthobacteraceae bacterium]
METLARLLLRVLLVPLGATVAIVVAVAVMLIAHRNGIAALANADPGAQDFWLFEVLRAGPLLAILLSLTFALTVLAAAVGALIAEAFAIRSWIYHAANGGLAAWIGWSLMNDADARYRFLTEPKILVAAGLAGGLAYWLVAGSTAGFWKPVVSRPAQS